MIFDQILPNQAQIGTGTAIDLYVFVIHFKNIKFYIP